MLATSPEDGQLYRPLKEDEIRVLEILPGDEDDMIQSRLKYTSLTSPVHYNALSYTWGDLTNPKVHINVDGHDLAVTENCNSALQELRREAMEQSTTQTIWIDAICINQADVPERNQQVLTMRSIYRHSKKLIIWMGSEADGSEHAIEAMKGASESYVQGTFKEWREHFEKNHNPQDLLSSVAHFFARPWFTRVWIMQEYIVSSQRDLEQRGPHNLEFYCGRARVSPQVFAQFYTGHLEFVHYLNSLMQASSPLLVAYRKGLTSFIDLQQRTASRFSLATREEFAYQLLRLIVAGFGCDSTDPRDRVYAHLGLISDLKNGDPKQAIPEAAQETRHVDEMGFAPRDISENYLGERTGPGLGSSDLIVDYNASVADVYSSLVRYVVFATKRLDILSLCHHRSDLVTRSWTIDLTTSSIYRDAHHQAGSLLLYSFNTMERNRHSSFCASNDASAVARFSPNLSILSVKGFRVSTIHLPAETGTPWPHKWQFSFLNKDVHIPFIRELVFSYKTNDPPETLRKTLWTVWTGGTFWEGKCLAFNMWRSWLAEDTNQLHEPLATELYSILSCQLNRNLFLTKDGQLVKAWNTVKDGDLVCVVLGCDVPLVLRPIGDHFELIGDCYVHGIMEGQAMMDLEAGKFKLETFDLH